MISVIEISASSNKVSNIQMLATLVVPVVAYKIRVTKLPPVLPKLIKVHKAV